MKSSWPSASPPMPTELSGEKPFRWSYGSDDFDPHADGKPAFSTTSRPLPISPSAAAAVRSLWSPGPKIPAPIPKWGHAFWANYGGHAAPK
jgi:hypothetical protein